MSCWGNLGVFRICWRWPLLNSVQPCNIMWSDTVWFCLLRHLGPIAPCPWRTVRWTVWQDFFWLMSLPCLLIKNLCGAVCRKAASFLRRRLARISRRWFWGSWQSLSARARKAPIGCVVSTGWPSYRSSKCSADSGHKVPLPNWLVAATGQLRQGICFGPPSAENPGVPCGLWLMKNRPWRLTSSSQLRRRLTRVQWDWQLSAQMQIRLHWQQCTNPGASRRATTSQLKYLAMKMTSATMLSHRMPRSQRLPIPPRNSWTTCSLKPQCKMIWNLIFPNQSAQMVLLKMSLTKRNWSNFWQQQLARGKDRRCSSLQRKESAQMVSRRTCTTAYGACLRRLQRQRSSTACGVFACTSAIGKEVATEAGSEMHAHRENEVLAWTGISSLDLIWITDNYSNCICCFFGVFLCFKIQDPILPVMVIRRPRSCSVGRCHEFSWIVFIIYYMYL